MSILRHLYLSTATRDGGETGGASDPDPPVVAEAPAPEVVAEDPPAEVTPEPAPQPAPAARAPTMVPLRILQERVGEETNKRQQAEQRAADLQAILDRMQTEPRTDPANPNPAPVERRAAPAARPADFDTAVKAEAQRQRFLDETVAVRSAGDAAFKDFGDTVAVLTAIGATSDDFLSDLFAVDRAGAHQILDKLAKDPERAASLVGMDTRRRIAELTRMSDATTKPAAPVADPAPKPAAPAQSRAPAPKPVIVPQAATHEVDPTTSEGNDKMTDQEWEAWYKGKHYKRA